MSAFIKAFPEYLALPCPLRCLDHFCVAHSKPQHLRHYPSQCKSWVVNPSLSDLSCINCQNLPEQGPEPCFCDNAWLLVLVFSWPHQEGMQKWKAEHATLYSITKQKKAKKITPSNLWNPEKNIGRHKWNKCLICRLILVKYILSKSSFMERIATEGREKELHYLKPLNWLLLEIMSCKQQSTKEKINTLLKVTQSSTQAQQSF